MTGDRRVAQTQQRNRDVVDYRRNRQAQYPAVYVVDFAQRLFVHFAHERGLHEPLDGLGVVVLPEEEHQFGDRGLRREVMAGDDPGGMSAEPVL